MRGRKKESGEGRKKYAVFLFSLPASSPLPLIRPISSSVLEVSTWRFREQIARSKKTPALQANRSGFSLFPPHSPSDSAAHLRARQTKPSASQVTDCFCFAVCRARKLTHWFTCWEVHTTRTGSMCTQP